jgi:nickel-type superoxide dismutase maturation protease
MTSQASLPRLKKRKFPLFVRQVAGGSMRPALVPGRIIIAVSGCRLPRIGDVVVVLHHGQESVKRVRAVQDGRLYVLGDDLENSTDSRSYGWLPMQVVQGIVVWPRIAGAGYFSPGAPLPKSSSI